VKFRNVLAALIFLVLPFSLRAYSQGFEISPVLIELAAQDRAEQVVLKNRTRRAISFDLAMRLWTQKDGEDILEDTDGLIISPPALTMKPGEVRTIRILRTVPADETNEISYRLILEEIPLKENKVPGRATLALVISIPLFAQPLRPSSPDFRVTLTKQPAAKGGFQLTLVNSGKSHARVLEAQPISSGKPLSDPLSLVGYALPGTTKSWEIAASGLAGADALRVGLPGGETKLLPLPR